MSNDHGKLDVAPTESETTRTVGNFSRGSRETQAASASREADRSEKANGHKSDMHAAGESDSSIVPKKPANDDGPKASAELVEGRGLTKENASRRYRTGHSAGNLGRADGWACEQRRQSDAVSSLLSEVRAVCGSSARTDPCEGRPARAVPIAIVIHKKTRVPILFGTRFAPANFTTSFTLGTRFAPCPMTRIVSVILAGGRHGGQEARGYYGAADHRAEVFRQARSVAGATARRWLRAIALATGNCTTINTAC